MNPTNPLVRAAAVATSILLAAGIAAYRVHVLGDSSDAAASAEDPVVSDGSGDEAAGETAPRDGTAGDYELMGGTKSLARMIPMPLAESASTESAPETPLPVVEPRGRSVFGRLR